MSPTTSDLPSLRWYIYIYYYYNPQELGIDFFFWPWSFPYTSLRLRWVNSKLFLSIHKLIERKNIFSWIFWVFCRLLYYFSPLWFPRNPFRFLLRRRERESVSICQWLLWNIFYIKYVYRHQFSCVFSRWMVFSINLNNTREIFAHITECVTSAFHCASEDIYKYFY